MATSRADAVRASSATIRLESGSCSVTVRPLEGASATDLIVRGRRVLADTPWQESVRASPSPARDEAEWVSRWRGGWHLCFPTSGAVDPETTQQQGFHGAASQTPWRVGAVTADAACLEWSDDHGLAAERTWQLMDDGLLAMTVAVNSADDARLVAIAEHLILGADVTAPIPAGRALRMDVPPRTPLAELDYSGAPRDAVRSWPGDPSEAWDRIDATTPARVAALISPDPSCVRVIGPDASATVRWSGLPHALLWEEMARSQDAPWNGQVMALGIEPTTTPHGQGTRGGVELVELLPGARIEWTVRLHVEDENPPQEVS